MIEPAIGAHVCPREGVNATPDPTRREGPSIRAGLVACDRLVREAVGALLHRSGKVAVVAEARDSDGVRALIEVNPAILLLVLAGDSERELPLLQRVSDFAAQTCVLIATAHADPALHTEAVERGARGIITLDQPGDVLIKAIQKVCAGEVWLDRVGTTRVLDHLTGRRRADDDPELMRIESLTSREREIVRMVSEGFTNQQLADRLFISQATARNHMTSILDKLDVSDRFQLAVYAFRRGLVRCPRTPAMLRVWDAMRQVRRRTVG